MESTGRTAAQRSLSVRCAVRTVRERAPARRGGHPRCGATRERALRPGTSRRALAGLRKRACLGVAGCVRRGRKDGEERPGARPEDGAGVVDVGGGLERARRRRQLERAFDGLHGAALVGSHQRHCRAGGIGASGPADSVDVSITVAGGSKLMTCPMPSTSRPRAAMSVATNTRTCPDLKSATAACRCPWVRLAWSGAQRWPRPTASAPGGRPDASSARRPARAAASWSGTCPASRPSRRVGR